MIKVLVRVRVRVVTTLSTTRFLSSSSLNARIAVTWAGRGKPCFPEIIQCSYATSRSAVSK